MLVRTPPGPAVPLPGGAQLEAFFDAIQMKQTSTAAAMLEANTNLALARENLTKLPLLEAAAAGNVPLVKRLLQLGADIDATGDTRMSAGSQMTALHTAIKHNQPEVCKVLLQSNANTEVMAFGYTTPLHQAFAERREEIAGWLLDYGADPFCEKQFVNDHATPFEYDITRSDGKLVGRMLGQDPAHPLGNQLPPRYPKTEHRFKPAHSAAKVLAERGADLLSAAAERGEWEAMLALMKAGVGLTNRDAQGRPLLQQVALAEHQAAGAKEFEAARWKRVRQILVEHGQDYDALAATTLGDVAQLRRLVAADRRVAEMRDQEGQTPLHRAVATDQLALTRFWIEAGAPLAATNAAGQTPLHLAAGKGLVEQLKVLLAAGVPTAVRDTNGWTPLEAAIQARQTPCIQLLLDTAALASHPERGLTTVLHEAAASGNVAALAALLETQTRLEARNELGLTPLQVAVHHGHLAAAALLVDKGADINARDPEGNTLLLQTIPRFFGFSVRDRPPTNWLDRLGNDPRRPTYQKYLTVGPYEQGPHAILQTVSFLLACGSDVKATNHAGHTAMQLAMDKQTALFDDRQPLLQLLEDAGADVAQRDAEGNTALHRAIHGVDASAEEALAAIIAAGADVNATNAAGKTPLHLAAAKIGGWDQLPERAASPLQALIKAKANVNAQDKEGLTPLHVLGPADTSFKREATGALLAAGAKVNLRDQRGRTPVHLFLSGKWAWSEVGECLDLLVKAGADLNVKDQQGKTPLHYLAALGGQSPMFFIRGIGDLFDRAKADVNARDNDGNMPLHIAAQTGTRDVFDWLVKHGAGLDATNGAGETPRLLQAHTQGGVPRAGPADAETDIFLATQQGKLEPLAALLKADPALANATNRFGQTPLRMAVQFHRTNVVAFLEQHGARWDVVSAVMGGRTPVVRELLSRQPAEVALQHYGTPLLHLAAANGDAETAKALIDAGAERQARDHRGLSALGVARLRHQPEVARVLRARGATENIFDAAYTGDSALATTLLQRDQALALVTNNLGHSVLEVAAGAGSLEVLKVLLSRGASPKQAAQRPLHLAAIYNQTNTAKLLLRHGAKVDAYDRSGFTPLHLAAIKGAADVAALLLKNDANPNQPTAEPSTGAAPVMPMMAGPSALRLSRESALHLAALTGQTNVLQLLLTVGASVNLVDGLDRTPLDLANQVSPFTAFWMQPGLGRMDPLGLAEPAALLPRAFQEQQRAAVSLLKKAGATAHARSPRPWEPFGAPLQRGTLRSEP